MLVYLTGDLGEYEKYGVATQISLYDAISKPENAVKPPLSNGFSLQTCSHTYPTTKPAWWMFAFSFGAAYITDITIYYREHCKYTIPG